MEFDQAFDEKILSRIPKEILLLSLFPALGGLFLFDAVTALLILAGGAAAAGGFIWLNRSLTHFLLSGKSKAVRTAILTYALRLLLIIALFFFIILFFSKKVIAFAAGFSMIIPVFLFEAVIALSQLRRWKN